MIGAGRHTGVTHLAVRMANYLTGVRGETIAVLEWNRHGDFERMGQYCADREEKHREEKRREGSCRILDVDYYPEAGAEELAFCLNQDYRRIIIDYGEITGDSILECARCDRKLIVGSFCEWQAEAFLEEVKNRKKRDQSWHYAAAFGSRESRKKWEKAFRLVVLRIPASEDAFAVTRADMVFFENLLK